MINKDESVIPKGDYCYNSKGTCPYWSIKEDLPEMENGYCQYLEKSDYQRNEEYGKIQWQNAQTKEPSMVTEPHEIPISLLWDQVKECGVNLYTDEESEKVYLHGEDIGS